jgi:predicted  nucleic acid-binding Zn-ribbon protein
MNEQVKRLEWLVQKQRDLIKEFESENRSLKTIVQALRGRIQDLEQQHIVIDREIAEIPIGFDLIPEEDLKRH